MALVGVDVDVVIVVGEGATVGGAAAATCVSKGVSSISMGSTTSCATPCVITLVFPLVTSDANLSVNNTLEQEDESS
jgi:hypothetical protein